MLLTVDFPKRRGDGMKSIEEINGVTYVPPLAGEPEGCIRVHFIKESHPRETRDFTLDKATRLLADLEEGKFLLRDYHRGEADYLLNDNQAMLLLFSLEAALTEAGVLLLEMPPSKSPG
jgi:hypothetical protein